MTPASLAPTRPSAVRIWRTGVLAAVLAAVVNSLLYLATRALGVDYVVTQPGQTVSMTLPVLILAGASVVALITGTAALWLMSRASWGHTVWVALVAVGYLVSLGNPLTATEQAATTVCLVAAHTVVAGAALIGPGRAARPPLDVVGEV